MRRPNDDETVTADERFREIAMILAVGVMRLRARGAIPTPSAHDLACENPHDSSIHVLEPRPQPSLIH